MAGKEAKTARKIGRPSLEEKQRKLETEGKDVGKKVMFKLSDEKLEKEERRRMEICSKMKRKRIKRIGRGVEGRKRGKQKVKRENKRIRRVND